MINIKMEVDEMTKIVKPGQIAKMNTVSKMIEREMTLLLVRINE